MQHYNWMNKVAGNALSGHHLLQSDVTTKLLRFLTRVKSRAMTRTLLLVEREMHLLSLEVSLARHYISLLIMHLKLRTARYLNAGLCLQACE